MTKYFKELNLAPIKNSLIILDIDGTLLADGDRTGAIDPAAAANVQKLTAQGNQVYLCSNGFSHKLERNRGVAKRLNVSYHETPYKKPLKISVVPIVTAANKPVIVIGDKFLTDGLLAVNLDVPYIEVRSLRSSKDPLHSRLGYLIDAVGRYLLCWLARPPYYDYELRDTPEPLLLTLLTRPPLTVKLLPKLAADKCKRAVKIVLFSITKKSRYIYFGGPESVIRSLTVGLTGLKTPHQLNPWFWKVSATVGVVAGVDSLKWALAAKQKGFIRTIVAGPNIVMTPLDEHGLLQNQAINKIVVPSQWNKEWWLTFDQALASLIIPWPAGVEDRGPGRDSKGFCLIYAKNVDEKIFRSIIDTLWEHKYSIVVSQYGQFKQAEYFRLLGKARFIVYLNQSESQGLALTEAWMANVPTLVWNRGYFEYQGKRFEDATVAAPYLSAECGLTFKDEADFEGKLIEFKERYDSLHPRDYALAHFTDLHAARNYLAILRTAAGADR